jgi:hypothetical protein
MRRVAGPWVQVEFCRVQEALVEEDEIDEMGKRDEREEVE